ncbi:MAG: hypothetical protein GC164_07995 [Phycisphaera sp.]|nr:hypothetical protein [Phycisphaera sp.]
MGMGNFNPNKKAFLAPTLALLVGLCVCWNTQSTLAQNTASPETQNRRCYNCHGQDHIADLSPAQRQAMVKAPEEAPSASLSNKPDSRPELYVSPDALAHSVHANISCVSCHPSANDLPHPEKMPAASCSESCHTPQHADYRRGIHAYARAKGDTRAPTCTSCHGGHDILKHNDPKSNLYPLNVIKLCAGCHEQHNDATPNGSTEKEHVANYMASVHGKAITDSGLIVAATCVSCHKSHDILPSTNTESSVHRDHIPDTCGKCHTGVQVVYAKSIHGKQLAAGNEKAPVCSDCHASHAITRADTKAFEVDIVNECGSCHNKPINGGKASLYETFRKSYHGQVGNLGSVRAARCSDCHGSHEILPPDDPDSTLHGLAKIQTCAKCHPKANANFVQYDAHADFHDGKRFPLLHGIWLYFVIIMSFTFTFFGLHSVLWFIRSSIERLRHGKIGHHHEHAKLARGVKRFTRINRINHAFVIITFFGLTLTGMPLFFSDQAWAQSLAKWFGGAHLTGIWHRCFAVMLIGNFAVHIWFVSKRITEHGPRKILLGPNSLFPRWKDVTDCMGMFKWFFVGGKKPPFDHWVYWEKFDYWAEIFGTFVIGGSGLMLWFPEFFSKFIPGWAFNVATIIHGYEALLAVGFIFTIHFFNAHLRWEKFPVDDVMFTGQLPEAEFAEERPVEYERLKLEGELDKLYAPPPKKWYRPVAVWIGILAMLIGSTIVVLIILGGLGWL